MNYSKDGVTVAAMFDSAHPKKSGKCSVKIRVTYNRVRNYYPTGKDEKETVMKEVLKYKKLARLATHTNAWLRQIADADPEKSLYENHITTGTTIDGKCIRLSTIEKYCGCMVMECFKDAFKKKEKYSSYRFDFCGYDGTLWCEPCEDGDMVAGFMKEHRNTGNGYYYLLINDNTMIGYDID